MTTATIPTAELIDRAYLTMAKGEPLPPDQDAAITAENPSVDEMKAGISRAEGILAHQKAAGSAADRKAAIEQRDRLRSDADDQANAIRDQIKKLESQLEVNGKTVQTAEAKVDAMETAVRCLRDAAPAHLRHTLNRNTVTRRMPLERQRERLTMAMDFFKLIAELEPSNDRKEPLNFAAVNAPARDILGMKEPIVVLDRDPGQPQTWTKDRVPAKTYVRIFGPALAKAQRLAIAKRSEVEKQLADVETELAEMDAAEETWRNYYVPA